LVSLNTKQTHKSESQVNTFSLYCNHSKSPVVTFDNSVPLWPVYVHWHSSQLPKFIASFLEMCGTLNPMPITFKMCGAINSAFLVFKFQMRFYYILLCQKVYVPFNFTMFYYTEKSKELRNPHKKILHELTCRVYVDQKQP
jgi:hypothetical protein